MKIQVCRNDSSGSNKHRRKIKAIRRSATFCCGYKERENELGKTVAQQTSLRSKPLNVVGYRLPEIRVLTFTLNRQGSSVESLLHQ